MTEYVGISISRLLSAGQALMVNSYKFAVHALRDAIQPNVTLIFFH